MSAGRHVRIIAIVGAALAATTLSIEAASGGPAAGAREGGIFRMSTVAAQVDSIDAAIQSFAGSVPIRQATCAGLLRTPDRPFPEGLSLVPELATALPRITDGGRTYTFTIRRGVRFSTGAPVTAADIAHTINRFLNPVMKAYLAPFFADIVGARAVLEGKAQTARGVVARGNTLTIRLTRPAGDFSARITAVCVLPRTLPADAEGAKAPVPTAAPYFIAEYVPGRRIVLERNRFYRGGRPRHLDRFEIELTEDDASAIDRVAKGELDYAWIPTSSYAPRAAEFRRKYGLNKTRFFGVPTPFLRMFALNTSRPLFRENPQLRQAVNFAVDRRALLRERGPLAGFLTDQYLFPGLPGFRDERIYPLEKPDLRKARQLAKGRLRGRRAVLYTIDFPLGLAQAQIVKQNLAKIGLRVEIKAFPGVTLFEKLATPGERFDIGWVGWLSDFVDPSTLNDLFHGARSPEPNFSRFNSPAFNRRLERAARLIGARRSREYGVLDVELARDAAPAVAYAYDNALTLVSERVGCVVVNPYLDLAAACLK
jgi:peptide/nickel transport system substrate-binding protein